MYAIVCSETTEKKWPKALGALREKYEKKWPGAVHVISYPTSNLQSCLTQLSQVRPAYTCFLTHYEECSKEFVSSVHRLTRRIDPATPFTDTIWGVLTGVEEEDVLFAIRQDSLVVRRVLGGTPVNLKKFESGSWYSEGEACASFHKGKDEGVVRKEACPQDTTALLVGELSADRDVGAGVGVDMMITSGHASEKDWKIGYSYPNGQFNCVSPAKMVGMSLEGVVHPISHNGSPKILSAAGNCRVGNIPQRDCMALAWMHSVGVVQMTGYLVSTWFGYGGWGVHSYFIDLPGTLSFAESFFANNQSLLAELHTKYIEHEAKSSEEYRGNSKDCSGLLFDRDSVAFYGDPAFEARLAEKPDQCSYDLKVEELPPSSESGWKKYQLTLTCSAKFNRSPVYIFPSTVSKYKVIVGNAIVTCRCVILPGGVSPGERRTVVYAVQ